MQNENWKPVKGYEGVYSISNLGRLKSEARLVVNNKSGGNRLIEESILNRVSVNSSGYLNCLLYKNNKGKPVYIHRLVAEHFITKVDGKNFVNHKNGIKTDNRNENLEWCTEKENIHHSINSGLSNLKTNCKKVIDLKTGKSYESIKEAALKNGHNKSTLTARLNGRLINNTTFTYL